MEQNFTSEGYFITAGNSNYNSFQASVRQRISHLTYLAGYTYSKSLDNASGYGEQINLLNPGQYSLSSFNVAHNFVVSYDYELPVYLLPGPSRLVKGLEVERDHPVLDRQSRLRSTRWTIARCWEPPAPAPFRFPSIRPNFATGPLSITNPRKGQPYFNTALFSPEDLGQIGTANRRFFAAPGLNNWDAALLKDTSIKEESTLEFRAEPFNAFNHAQFGQPDGNVNSGTFGIISTANSPRIMQLSLKLLF